MRNETMRAENRKARMLRGLSGKSQARAAAEIGRSPAQMDQWEQGKAVPGAADLALLAERTAGISAEDAEELLALYEVQRRSIQRRSEGLGAVVDDLAAKLVRHCAGAVQRLLKLPASRAATCGRGPPAGGRAARGAEAAECPRAAVRGEAQPGLSELGAGGKLLRGRRRGRLAQPRERSAAWARLALVIAKWVQGPEGWRRRVRGYALAHWANLLKVRGDLKTADLRLEEAKALWLAGCDPAGLLDPGRLLDLEGSLRRDQRRFAEALSCFEQALLVSRFPEHALMMKGTTYDVMGEHEKAIAALRAAEPHVERRGDPRLKNMLRLNLGSSLVLASRYGEAAELVAEVRRCPEGLGKIDLARIPWLEGRIEAGLGRREEALRLLAAAREGFAAEEMFYDVALALLEEGALLLAVNRTQEVQALTRELPKVFASQGVHREALAALRIFQEAVEREAATAELARRVLRFLFRARYDQGLRFTAS